MARISIELDRAAGAIDEDVCSRLESGDILYFPTNPLSLNGDDRAFLLGQKQVDASYHKNVSYRPVDDRLKGLDADDAARERTHAILREYSRNAVRVMAQLFPSYARSWKIDFASYRPIEEAGRKVSRRSRNDLIHIDSFPTRPSHGDRLLRIFSNIHPSRPRVWVTSESFEPLAHRYAEAVGLPKPRSAIGGLKSRGLRLLSSLGVPVVDRPPYDHFMLRFHHFLKESEEFQRECVKERWEFPPDTSWICFTDTTSHSCISGQHALEQTFIVRKESLTSPDKAPIAILERMSGFPLAGGPSARSA